MNRKALRIGGQLVAYLCAVGGWLLWGPVSALPGALSLFALIFVEFSPMGNPPGPPPAAIARTLRVFGKGCLLAPLSSLSAAVWIRVGLPGGASSQPIDNLTWLSAPLVLVGLPVGIVCLLLAAQLE